VRKLFWQMNVTLDGFMEGRNRELEDTVQVVDEDFGRYATDMVTSVRPTEQVEGSRFVTNVWRGESSWTIIFHETVICLNSAPSH
jgi:hypothetical protein